jgi:hypothetical protein
MNGKAKFLKHRHASLFRAIENLEHNFNMFRDFQELPVVEFEEIQDRIEEAISEVKAIRMVINDKISELEAAS